MDGIRHIDRLALSDGFAAVEAFHDGQFMTVVFDELGEFQQSRLAVARCLETPTSVVECLSRFGDRIIDVACIARCDLCQRLARCGVRGGECLAGIRRTECPVYEGVGRQLKARRNGLVLGSGQRFMHCWLPT